MKLHKKTYNRQQINEFKEATNTNRNLDFLLDNISCFRLLGWSIVLPEELRFNTQGFGDVIKFTQTKKPFINRRARILCKEKK